jgi:hypothetical protein
MNKNLEHTQAFIKNIHAKEYSDAFKNLQIIVSEKIKSKIKDDVVKQKKNWWDLDKKHLKTSTTANKKVSK